MEIPEAVLLAVLAAVGGGIALVYKDGRKDRAELRADANAWRDRFLQSADLTDEAIVKAEKKSPGA